ncbi:MAG: translation initiation factor 1 [Verrucomicrobiales bacterium]
MRFLRFAVEWPMSRKKATAAGSGDEPPPNVFGALDVLGNLPVGPEDSLPVIPVKTSKHRQKNTSRGRVDIIRQTAHRGGKAVTVAKNFTGIGLAEKQDLAKTMRKACGVGGTVKDGCIEIQGDQRDKVKRILTEAGFNPVFSGG